jgi:hypothetical protein
MFLHIIDDMFWTIYFVKIIIYNCSKLNKTEVKILFSAK